VRNAHSIPDTTGYLPAPRSAIMMLQGRTMVEEFDDVIAGACRAWWRATLMPPPTWSPGRPLI